MMRRASQHAMPFLQRHGRRTALISLSLVTGIFMGLRFRWFLWSLYTRIRGRLTVSDRLDNFGPAARVRLRRAFEHARVLYPPRELILVGLKAERELRIYSRQEGQPHLALTYPILALSGAIGPKLREGDRQVPEGVYSIESLNPNSAFHLSLRLDYPNRFDLARAQAEGRSALGGDIMIHGGSVSIGCLAIGDLAIEDLFVLVADVGIENVRVVMSPHDFRSHSAQPASSSPWDRKLYAALKREFHNLRDR